MQKRPNAVTFKGKGVTLAGPEPRPAINRPTSRASPVSM